MSKPDAVHAVHKAGYAVTFDKFQFITINGAGHMVRDNLSSSSSLRICFMTHLSSVSGSSIPTCLRGNHVSQVLERREVLNTGSAVLYKVKEYETINKHHCLQVT